MPVLSSPSHALIVGIFCRQSLVNWSFLTRCMRRSCFRVQENRALTRCNRHHGFAGHGYRIKPLPINCPRNSIKENERQSRSPAKSVACYWLMNKRSDKRLSVLGCRTSAACVYSQKRRTIISSRQSSPCLMSSLLQACTSVSSSTGTFSRHSAKGSLPPFLQTHFSNSANHSS